MTTPPALPSDLLLLAIDLQPKFLAAMADAATVQRRCEFAVAAARGLGLSVAFTEQVPEKLGVTAPTLRALAPEAPVWAKQTFSALADDAIRAALLEHHRVQHLLLCGIETPVCVYQTAVAAIAEDIQVTILSDAVGARRPDDAHACLAALARAGAHVLPSETVFYA
ncbi:MAG: isochorismatase family protein, partial [Opitutaceae bacterium]